MGKPKEIKSTSSRVTESVNLVKKFRELGIADTEPGLVALRGKLNDWIKGAPAWTGRIEFPRYGRYADVILPDKEGCVCSANFKMHK
jgi:hypothetical protein